MKNNRTSFQSILHSLVFATIGSFAGLISGYVYVIDLGNLAFLSLIIGLLDGIYLRWVYKSKDISVNLVTRIGIGMVIGMFLGSVFGGWVGTILSFPFPDGFFTTIFLIGTFFGMLIGGAALPMILVNLGAKNPK